MEMMNEIFFNFTPVKKHWSKARNTTVGNLFKQWHGVDNQVYIFDDNRLEGENLAMLKLKDLKELEERYNNLVADLELSREKVKKCETIIDVARGLVDKKSKDVFDKLATLH